MQARVAQKFGEGQLETLNLTPRGDPSTAQGIYHFGDFIFADIWKREGQKGLSGRVHAGSFLFTRPAWVDSGSSKGLVAQISTCVRSHGRALKT